MIQDDRTKTGIFFEKHDQNTFICGSENMEVFCWDLKLSLERNVVHSCPSKSFNAMTKDAYIHLYPRIRE